MWEKTIRALVIPKVPNSSRNSDLFITLIFDKKKLDRGMNIRIKKFYKAVSINGI